MQVEDSIAYHETHSSLKYDGHVRENVYLNCDDHQSGNITNKMELRSETYCSDLTTIAQYKFRSLVYFFGQHHVSTDDHDVTLVTHITFDRVSRLPLLLSYWTGPVSVAIYTADEEIEELYNALNSSVMISERGKKNLAVHVVFNHTSVYPVNYLRNAALDYVTTPFVLLHDADFLPNFDCYSGIKKAIDENDMINNKKTALVLPAFETVEQEVSLTALKSKQELLSLIRTKKVRQFHIKVCAKAHSPTMYNKWNNTDKPYKVEYSLHYEPYVVVSSDVVRYDTRFVGFGWNKVSHIMELHADSYSFIVLPELFLLHLWHPVSPQKKKLFMTEQFTHCLRIQKKASREYLVSKYGKLNIE